MSYLDKHLNNIFTRLQRTEQQVSSIYQVLQEIIGKELLRGQALHKVLMDKAIFTDTELKTALETLMAEAKADMQKLEAETNAAKAKVELLVPEGANLTPPVDPPTPAPELPSTEVK